MNYATFYLSDPSLIGSKIFDQFPQIISYLPKNENNKATGILVKLAEAEIEMNFMNSDDITNHLEGLHKFAYNYIYDGIDFMYVRSRIHYIRLPIGCVINPGFDKQGNVLNFLQDLNKAFNSLMFIDSKLFDYDMRLLAGSKSV